MPQCAIRWLRVLATTMALLALDVVLGMMVYVAAEAIARDAVMAP